MTTAAGNFVASNTSVPVTDPSFVTGTVLGAPLPQLRGHLLINGIGQHNYHGHYGYYTGRMFLEIGLMIASVTTILLVQNKKQSQQLMIRGLFVFFMIIIGLKFQAHAHNTIRTIALTSMAQIYGGYAN